MGPDRAPSSSSARVSGGETAPPKVRGLRPSRRSPGGLTTSPRRCWADPTTSGATERSIERRTNHDQPDAAGAIERFRQAAADWRRVLLSVDESDYDQTGLSSYPYGSDAEETFPSIVWWENQEILHHGAEIALLRDLYVHHAQ